MIRFVDLKAQYHSIKEEIDSAVLGVLESTQFVLGKEVAAFEEEFASYSQAAHGVAVNSGTSALHLAFLAAGIGPGDEVITVPKHFHRHGGRHPLHGAPRRSLWRWTSNPSPWTPRRSKRPSLIRPRRFVRCIFMARWRTWTRSWLLPASTSFW